MPTPPEIQAADPKSRLTALAIVLVLGVGALVIWCVESYQREIAELVKTDREAAVAKMRQLADIMAVSMGVPLVAAGAWLVWMSRRIATSDRFPPVGMRVVRNTPIRTGAAAQRIASLGRIGAVLLITFGTAGMWLFRFLVRGLLAG